MILTIDQIDRIISVVQEQGVIGRTLSDDLIDHLCCDVEKRMDAGEHFEMALQNALVDLSPDGLDVIETRTESLLYPTRLIMKKTIYFIGLVTSISMTMGIMFKLLHMPGGEQLFNYGFLAFALIYFPGVAVLKWKTKTNLPLYEKLKWIAGFASTVGIGAAVLLKLMTRYEPSGIILMISVSIFCFGYLPFQFYSFYKDGKQEKEIEWL